MRRARTGVVLLTVAALAGCGGSGKALQERRVAVNAYFKSVDQAEAALLAQGTAIQTALRKFSTRANSPDEIQALQRAEDELLRTRQRMAGIDPPADARRLHADFNRLLDLEAVVTHELVWTARYTPQLDRAIRPLRPAAVALSRDLKQAKKWQADAAAFARYRTALASVLASLDRLSAPPTLRPTLDGERRILRRSVALCSTIQAALAKRDVRAANTGIRTLFGLGAGSLAVKTRLGQIAAARAYNGRLDEIAALGRKIVRERLKLVQGLG